MTPTTFADNAKPEPASPDPLRPHPGPLPAGEGVPLARESFLAPPPARIHSRGAACGLYVHIPFCETKCGYCDFYSVVLKDRNTAPLVDALIRELDFRLGPVSQEERSRPPITTIFCGGGTPTLLPTEQLRRLLDAIRRTVSIANGTTSSASLPDPLPHAAGASIDSRQSAIHGSFVVEFTVEANPATLDDAKAELLVASGVTRVSMGAQSFFPSELATLERLHSPDDIAPSVEILRRHGIGQINLDLIFGIPGQTPDTWRQSLQRAIDLGPDHIACYGLTFEPATRLTAQRDTGRVVPCDEDLEADMFLLTMDVLEAAGFRQYEISNYARPGCECRHNLIYWRNQPYVGIGPSAAGCYAESDGAIPARRERSDEGNVRTSKRQNVETKRDEGDASVKLRRYKNVPDVAAYTRMIEVQEHAEIEVELIEGDTLALELILMQLRLNEGLSIADFAARTGSHPRYVFGETLVRLVGEEAVAISDSHIALTRRGRLIANRVIDELACCTGRKGTALPVL